MIHPKLGRPLKYGMIGGGPGAFIGAVHRKAAAMDGGMELVAGSFSSNPEKSRAQGKELGLNPARVYDSYQEMAEQEAKLPEGERIDFASIVTPNHVHYDAARVFIEAGFHVVCDKPMTNTMEDALALCRLVEEHDVVFALTHNYTGYPMVKQGRELIRQGKLGTLRKIVVEYPQGWLSDLQEAGGNKQAEWRTDPARSGISSAIGDIGSHAENLARYMTSLEIEALCADITTFVPGRLLEDDANMLLHYKGGAKGVLMASQISAGDENNLRIRIYGSDASMEWRQENPNYLHVRFVNQPEEVYKRGNPYLFEVTQHASRTPFGHPEGYLEAFANIYVNAGRTIIARLVGETPSAFDLDFPTVIDGARGVHFIHKAVESGKKGGWIDAAFSM